MILCQFESLLSLNFNIGHWPLFSARGYFIKPGRYDIRTTHAIDEYKEIFGIEVYFLEKDQILIRIKLLNFWGPSRRISISRGRSKSATNFAILHLEKVLLQRFHLNGDTL